MSDIKMTIKDYDRELDEKVGKPGVIQMVKILSTFPCFANILCCDHTFDPKTEKCKGDARVVKLPNKDFDLVLETEVRKVHYRKVESGQWRTAHVPSRKAGGRNKADIYWSWNEDLTRFYTMSMDVVRSLPISSKGPADDGNGGTVLESWVDVPREYIRFCKIDYDKMKISVVWSGDKYVQWENLWVPDGGRDLDGIATRRITN